MKVTKLKIEEILEVLFRLQEQANYVDVEISYAKNTITFTPLIEEHKIEAA